MSRRDDILDEMGLAPRWTLRPAFARPAAASVPAAAAVAAVAEADDRPPPPVPPARERSAVSDPAPAQAAVPPADDATGAAETRDAAILQMDWPALADAVSGCTGCGLAATRQCTVFGVGDHKASWLFVGEGPGAEEDARGEPFVGQAGRLLDNMLAALQMRRGEDVYIANIVKCRPPDNRVPSAAEVAACEPYLHRQIQLLQPRVIVALGKTAAVTLLGREQSIASMRGKVFSYRDTPLMVTYHPAYLLRTLPDKVKAWEDLCFIRDRVAEWQAAQPSGSPTAG